MHRRRRRLASKAASSRSRNGQAVGGGSGKSIENDRLALASAAAAMRTQMRQAWPTRGLRPFFSDIKQCKIHSAEEGGGEGVAAKAAKAAPRSVSLRRNVFTFPEPLIFYRSRAAH